MRSKKRITVKELKEFNSELTSALKNNGLNCSRGVMEKYNIGYTTKYTKNRYVLESIIAGLSAFSHNSNTDYTLEETNRLSLIEEFLDNGVNPNELDDYGWSLLETAVSANSPKCCELLLKRGADPNNEDTFNECPLSLNWRRIMENSRFYSDTYIRRRATLEILLKYGANPWNKMTVWHCNNLSIAYAIMSISKPGCVDLRRNINPILYNRFSNERSFINNINLQPAQHTQSTDTICIDDACRAVYSIRPFMYKGDINSSLDLLFTQFGIGYNTKISKDNSYFFCLLFSELNELNTKDTVSIRKHYHKLLIQFFDSGIDLNHIDNYWELSILTIASYNREPELCRALLKRGADPNFKNKRGVSPLSAAINSYEFDMMQGVKNKECITTLLKCGCEENPYDYVYSNWQAQIGIKVLVDAPSTEPLIKLFQKCGISDTYRNDSSTNL